MFLRRKEADVTRKSGFATFVTDLDAPLLRLSPTEIWSLRAACGGSHIFGGIGSGKTSGSGRMIAGAYLRAGMGGLVTCVKAEDAEMWRRYLVEHGRSQSLLLFDATEGFNFLTYFLALYGMEGIGTVTESLMKIVEAARSASGTASKSGQESVWEDSTRVLLRYTIPVLYAADGTVSIGAILRFISTAATSTKQADDAAWQGGSFMWEKLKKASNRPTVPMERAALNNAVNYWYTQFTAIPDKMRGSILGTVIAALDRFQHGRLQRAFCGKTTLVPELTFHGVIILLAMPTLTWGEDGIIAQQLFKFIWQRSVLNRNSLAEKHRERPLFLFSDEAQETANSYDAEFLSLCRGSKCCVTYLTQSLPNYYVKMTGNDPRDAAHSLVGKFNTHIYHSNACTETNEYASRMIGKVLTRRANYSRGNSDSYTSGLSQGSSETSGTSSSHGSSSSTSPGGGTTSGSNSSSGHSSSTGSNWGMNQSRGTSSNTSRGYTESMEYAVEPGDFARILRTGGKANGNLVTGVWFQSGRIFKDSDSNILLETFAQ